MICPKCRNDNDDQYVFCVNCGTPISHSDAQTAEYPSVNTVVAKRVASEPPPTINMQAASTTVIDDAATRSPFASNVPERGNQSTKVIVGIVALLIAALGVIAAGVIYFNRPVEQEAALPDHLGVFLVDSTRNTLTEIPKREFESVKAARDSLVKETIAFTGSSPREFILYADAAEIKIDDLKLVTIDSIKDSGTMRQLEYQASLVDEKPAMKRLRFPNSLANGRYAFALFNGPFDEGKHRLWAFEVVGSTASDPNAGRELTIALKEKTTSDTPKPPLNPPANTNAPAKSTVDGPVGSRVVYCNSSDVVVRASPSLTARKVNGLRRGQKVYLLSYSDNYDSWNGIRANWAHIQTESGKRGWVFTPFISN